MRLKKYYDFIKESIENDEGFTLEQLYDEGADLISQAAKLLEDETLRDADPSEVIDRLKVKMRVNTLHWSGDKNEDISNLIKDIENVQNMINDFPEDENEW